MNEELGRPQFVQVDNGPIYTNRSARAPAQRRDRSRDEATGPHVAVAMGSATRTIVAYGIGLSRQEAEAALRVELDRTGYSQDDSAD